MATKSDDIALLAPGAQVEVRDEEWIVRSVQATASDGHLVRCIGTSELVRDQEASFFTSLDDVKPLRPEDTRLVADDSPNFRRSRLMLEALLRKTPLPIGDPRPAIGHRQLLDELEYQKQAVDKALRELRPRLLIADAVGLGKTLEVGMILAELIRRGRGDRILVVTPKSILEQFQHEVWTRFSISLVRLDSEGVQRIRQKIPAARNPFTYYKRAIISIDTLKNGRYRHHLESIQWDAVVIDECHNVTNRATLNSELARVLAPRTDALILTSATPHNGKPESFAELVKLLDPTAIADSKHYSRTDIEHVYLRRFKKDVAAEVGDNFAERRPPEIIHAAATAPENAVVEELAATWLFNPAGAPTSGAGSTLFPWTLFKAFLSSHHALAETIRNRRKTVQSAAAADGAAKEFQRELDALANLEELVTVIDDDKSSKLASLVETLRAIGIGAKSNTRVVVFSERNATLAWLADRLPKLLGLGREAIDVLNGGLPDKTQQDMIERFGLTDAKVRVLLAADVGSEGVNLHRQCHHLVHFDVPWSLIRIQQRNGRIDRYGQRHQPEIRAIALVPDHHELSGDVHVIERLIEKEDEAHRTLGEAEALFGLYDPDEEEAAVIRGLKARRSIDEIVADEPRTEFDLMMLIGGGAVSEVVETNTPLSLFDSDFAFFNEALREAYPDAAHDLELHREPEHQLVSFVPPADLCRRLDFLPQSYLSEQKVTERIRLTADRAVAFDRLRHALDSSDSMWPEVHYLGTLHPVLDWLADKVLVGLQRNEAYVLAANVTEPTFLVQGVYSNQRGQATIVEWIAIRDLTESEPHVAPMLESLRTAGVSPSLANPQQLDDLPALQLLVPTAVEAGRAHMRAVRDERDQELAERLQRHLQRVKDYEQLALDFAPTQKHKGAVDRTAREQERLVESLRTRGEPLVRVVAVLVSAR